MNFPIFTALIAAAIAILLPLVSNAKAETVDPCTALHTPRADVEHRNDNALSFDADPVDIPLTVDLAERFGLDGAGGLRMESPLGFISVYKDGRILYDGKDISSTVNEVCSHGSNASFTRIP